MNKPKEDLVELWKRVVFNMAVSNTDDHLRNHAFIYTKSGWILSPLYDVNPVPYGSELSLNVNELENEISLDIAIEAAHYFGIGRDSSNIIAKEIALTVRDNWELLARRFEISRGQIEDMRPAFSECYR